MNIYWQKTGSDVNCLDQLLDDFDVVVLHQNLSQSETPLHLLSKAERLRMEQFDPTLASLFAAARVFLRQGLSLATNISPQDISFLYGENGKPFIDGNPVHFNLAHSRDFAVLAISKTHRVGVDIEIKHPVPEWRDISRNWHEGDKFCIQNQDDFLRFWVIREAILKAFGIGLASADHLNGIPMGKGKISTPWGVVHVETTLDQSKIVAVAMTNQV